MMRGRWKMRAWRTGALAAAGVLLFLAALLPVSCSDECSRTSDCPDGQYCFQGGCRPLAGDADADADVDVRPDADADVEPDESAGAEDAEDAGDDGVHCTDGLTWCGGTSCIDLLTTNEHCGDCDAPCGAGETCVGGGCVIECSGAGLSCGGECVDRLSDPDNCGTCDNPCIDPQVCAAGACVATCPAETTPCGRACADVLSSIDHCGDCYSPCGDLEWCVGGTCFDTPCALGDLFCDGSCVPPDVNNCGDCDIVCDPGFLCCNRLFVEGMICANTASDPQYCGSCTNLCPPGQNCVAGVCTPV